MGVVAICLATAMASVGMSAGHAAPAVVADPVVEGPIGPVGLWGHPWNDQFFEVASIGYTEDEYFVSGTAKTYTATPTSAPYKTRILVYHPTNPRRFNGTTIVEWDNVTAQNAEEPLWTWLHPMVFREGYAYVFVSSQAAAICCGPRSHKVWDPVRYGGLSHPGDDYSFDIYSQVVQAVRRSHGVDPMGGLKTKRVLAVGNSQSASRLHTYVNTVQGDAGVVDAFLLDAGGSKTFGGEPAVPVIQLLSEDGLSPAAPNVSMNYRLWEVPGASHNDADTGAHDDTNSRTTTHAPKQPYSAEEEIHRHSHYGEEGLSTHATCSPVLLDGGNEYPRRYAVRAAVHHLDNWVKRGTPAPTAPRAEFNALGLPSRDEHGNALGGLRLPPLDVPVATYAATTCGLFGLTIAFDPATLAQLYPSHDDYVTKMQAATDRAMAAGFLLAPDGGELMTLARASSIGVPR
jgi:alpha/beta hydrolase family protein